MRTNQTKAMKRIEFPSKESAVLVDNAPEPGPPKTGEITVETDGCGICQQEIKQYKGLLGQAFPVTRLGHESVGRVVAVGEVVEALAEGDFVTTLWAPGFCERFNVQADWAMALDASRSVRPGCFDHSYLAGGRLHRGDACIRPSTNRLH